VAQFRWPAGHIRTLNDQCLHSHRFETLHHASCVVADFIGFYNDRRPHLALGMKTLAEAYALAVWPVQKQLGQCTNTQAMCEAVQRPQMRFVPIKSEDAQGRLSIHRVRQEFNEHRTDPINRIPGRRTRGLRSGAFRGDGLSQPHAGTAWNEQVMGSKKKAPQAGPFRRGPWPTFDAYIL
jgi:hypothetical protein